MGPQRSRAPVAVYGVPGEADLVGKICDILAFKPLEVNNLSSKFASIFNEVVRSHEETPFMADKKNDGSFKKWLMACGFEVGPLFNRNQSLVYLPARPAWRKPNQERRGFYRGKHGGIQSLAPCEVPEVESLRWEVKEDSTPREGRDESMPAALCESESDLASESADLDAWVEVEADGKEMEEDFIFVESDGPWEEVPPKADAASRGSSPEIGRWTLEDLEDI